MADNADASADTNSGHALLAGAVEVKVGEYVGGAGRDAQVGGCLGNGHELWVVIERSSGLARTPFRE